MGTAKRDRPSPQCIHECVIAVHLRLFHGLQDQHLSSAGPTKSVQFCTDAAASAGATSPLGAGNGGLPWTMCNATGRTGRLRLGSRAVRTGFRDFTFAIAEAWLSLARRGVKANQVDRHELAPDALDARYCDRVRSDWRLARRASARHLAPRAVLCRDRAPATMLLRGRAVGAENLTRRRSQT